MIVGIVGSEEAKFTELGASEARRILRSIIDDPSVTEVVSGKCHLGGIDIWAIDIAKNLGIATTEFVPERLSWEFFKKRNLLIAERSDIVYCITVNELPPDFKGMRFDYCYHCGKDSLPHVKSGGCWTLKQAILRGKHGTLRIVRNF
jgi:hypothetical protein